MGARSVGGKSTRGPRDLTDYERRYRCEWCGQWSVVPSLAVEHEERCEVRPVRGVA